MEPTGASRHAALSPFPILHASAYLTVGGVALAQVIEIGVNSRLLPVAVLLAMFIVALFFSLEAVHAHARRLFIVLSVAETVLITGIMVVGTSVLLGAILFFVLGSMLAMKLPFHIAFSWLVLASGLMLACMLWRRQPDWLPTFLSLTAGYFAVMTFAVAVRRSHDARVESQRLLEELTSAQGRLAELAVLEERQRLARDMHDAVGHRLTAAAVLLEGASRLIAGDPARAAEMVETSREQVREGLAELRRAVSALRSDEGGERPLEDVIRRLARSFAKASGTRILVNIQEGLAEPDPERRTVVVRTAEEALTNVHKHAAAASVELAFGRREGAWVLSCRDDGRGPASAGGSSGGFGLRSLRERAARFGGSVELEAHSEGGSVLRLVLPGGEA
jgi:signal transduction histidine kinase